MKVLHSCINVSAQAAQIVAEPSQRVLVTLTPCRHDAMHVFGFMSSMSPAVMHALSDYLEHLFFILLALNDCPIASSAALV